MGNTLRVFAFAAVVFALFRLYDAIRGPAHGDATLQMKRVAAEFERQILTGQGDISRISESRSKSAIKIRWRVTSQTEWSALSNAIAVRLQPRFHLLHSAPSRLTFASDRLPGEEWSVVIFQSSDNDHASNVELAVYAD